MLMGMEGVTTMARPQDQTKSATSLVGEQLTFDFGQSDKVNAAIDELNKLLEFDECREALKQLTERTKLNKRQANPFYVAKLTDDHLEKRYGQIESEDGVVVERTNPKDLPYSLDLLNLGAERDMNNKRAVEAKKRVEPKSLWDIHLEILRLAATGLNHVEIARLVGMTEDTIKRICLSKLGQERLIELRKVADCGAIDVTKRIQELAPRAIARVEEIMDNEKAKEELRLKAALEILDRAGHSAVKTIRTEGVSVHLSSDQLAEISRRGRDLARAQGLKLVGSNLATGEQRSELSQL